MITSQSGIIYDRSEPTTAWRPQADPRPEAWPTCRNWADPGDPDPIALPPCIDNLREVGAGCCPGMRAIIIIGCKTHTPTYTTNPGVGRFWLWKVGNLGSSELQLGWIMPQVISTARTAVTRGGNTSLPSFSVRAGNQRKRETFKQIWPCNGSPTAPPPFPRSDSSLWKWLCPVACDQSAF